MVGVVDRRMHTGKAHLPVTCVEVCIVHQRAAVSASIGRSQPCLYGKNVRHMP